MPSPNCKLEPISALVATEPFAASSSGKLVLVPDFVQAAKRMTQSGIKVTIRMDSSPFTYRATNVGT